MKANELQICDWVYIEEGDELGKTQVVAISEDNTDWLHPILLTPEILEKNGWEHDTKLNHWWHSDVEFVIWYNLMTFQDFYCCEITTMKFDYVHQLQHALRLCGLNELADNFKV